jgi:DnaB-like helicase N terminal domain/AAA domain
MNPKLPPHDYQAEAGLLSCLLQEPALMQTYRTKREVFHDLRCQIIFDGMREMFDAKTVIDVITLQAQLKKHKLLSKIGGVAALMKLMDVAPSAANHSYYFDIVREKAALRKLDAACDSVKERIATFDGKNATEFVGTLQADLDTVSRLLVNQPDKKQLEMWTPSQLLEYTIPERLRLVGENEIIMGYDGLFLIAGPGSSGKSLCGMTLALAGAQGDGFWQGRKICRPFKTMILQAENGAIRLKDEFEAIKNAHPTIDLDASIMVSSPPEGGLPFHRGDFRAAVREEAIRFRPDIILLDTWSQVASEDAAKEVVDKIGEIRSCFSALEHFPAIGILAHTKKPRAEEVRKGRGLINQIAGSIALGNTARTVYMLLPWSDDMEDERIYWACVKLNNAKMYPASVWRRRFGTFFQHDPTTDAREFGKVEDDVREKITRQHLEMAFEGTPELTRAALVKKLNKASFAGESTCYRAISDGPSGYLAEHLRFFQGKVTLKPVEAGK